MEKLIEQIAKAPTGMKVAVVSIVAVLITALNYLVIGVPSFGDSVQQLERRIDRAQVEQRKLDQDMIEKRAIANNLNQFRREKELLEQRLQEALAELPDDKRLDELLQLFQDRATKAGVEILSIEPKPATTQGFYAQIPIPMAIQGGYHEIASFLDGVGRLRRIVNVNGLSFGEPKDLNGKLVLQAKFMATTFMFTNEAKQPAGPAGKGKPGAAKRGAGAAKP